MINLMETTNSIMGNIFVSDQSGIKFSKSLDFNIRDPKTN